MIRTRTPIGVFWYDSTVGTEGIILRYIATIWYHAALRFWAALPSYSPAFLHHHGVGLQCAHSLRLLPSIQFNLLRLPYR